MDRAARRERAERWASILAMAFAAFLVGGSWAAHGIGVAVVVAMAFALGVVAQRV